VNENLKREKQVGVSLTKKEYQEVRLVAFQKEKSISQYIRDALLKQVKKDLKNGNNLSEMQ